MRPPRISGKVKITLSERFLSLIFGAFFGFLTFLYGVWYCSYKAGPPQAKLQGLLFIWG